MPETSKENFRKEAEMRSQQEADEKAREEVGAGSGGATREVLPPPPPLRPEEALMHFMQRMEEDRREEKKSLNRFFSEMLNRMDGRPREGASQARGRVTLGDFQEARPLTFFTAAEPMHADCWTLKINWRLWGAIMKRKSIMQCTN
jgi:hypothetical protein